MNEAKPFDIPKRLIWEAYKRVKSNQGAAGVDGQSIQEFDQNRDRNLYKIWNRMSSGTYFAPPVRAVSIPKKAGGERILGVPTISDRIAQSVVTMLLEPRMEKVFHPDSYGYRSGKSAHDALSVTRRRCWEHDWVLEYDIRGLFDNIDHELLLKALHHHCDEPWVHLYVRRWLVAPMQRQDGQLVKRTIGTPQGGPLSPLLANLFLHYALDNWLATNYAGIPFCRYADDGILHCSSFEQAASMRRQLASRLRDCGLELHPLKTRIVYCKDSNRRGCFENVQFDFLGFTFRPRAAWSKSGAIFTSFLPAISRSAMRGINQRIRSWRLGLKSDRSIEYLANWTNKIVTGWINYYGRFYKSALEVLALRLDSALVHWAMRKFKRFRGHKVRAILWLRRQRKLRLGLFVHWLLVRPPTAGAMGAQ